MVRTGLEIFVRNPPSWSRGRRIGLLCHQASVDSSLRHARHLLHEVFPGQLKCLFSPQHGLFSEKQDNMVESPHEADETLGIPVFSLYGETRQPTPEMLGGIDLLVVDLQDVGCRVYTYIWTLLLAMKACAAAGVGVVVLDRPNPIGGVLVEGNLLDPGCRSFVGMAPLPMRHGMTMGEMARFFQEEFSLDMELHVTAMEGWKRRMEYEDTGLPWVWPSPNMPTPDTARVYPGQVIFEGTNISEGRGTTRPFEIFGAPFLNRRELLRLVEGQPLSGFGLRDQQFEPTFHKWAGRRCCGFQIHVTDSRAYRPWLTTLSLVAAVIKLHPEEFSWREPPYEYEQEKLPADLILGDRRVREALEAGADVHETSALWDAGLREFTERRKAWLLYG